MNFNFEYYKVFYYVAKYGSLTRAASVLMTSQPAVTRTIRNLENDLSCRLFIRSKSGVELTPEGKVFYEYVATGCEQFSKGVNELGNMISLADGTVYISATETALHGCLFEAMEEFNASYPNVHFKILNNSTTKSIQALKNGKVDMAVVSAPFHIPQPLKMSKLCDYRDVLIGGKRFEELKGRKVALEELTEFPWISLTQESITRDFVNEYFEEHSLSFHPIIELDTTDMILPAVRHNLGIGFIPEALARADMEAGNVFEIQMQEPFPLRSITMIYDTEYPRSIASQAFRKFLVKRQKGAAM